MVWNMSCMKKIYHILEEFNSSDAFLELEKKYNLILFGGAVRDFVFFPEQYEVRDLDFVMVGVESVASVKEILRQYFYAITNEIQSVRRNKDLYTADQF